MRFDRTAYGTRVRQLRIAKRLTQEQLAEKMSVTSTYIGKIENGQQTGPVELAVELATFFEISIDDLLLGRDCQVKSKKQKIQDAIKILVELETEL